MRCPICQKKPDPEFAPFCTKHCKNTDLIHWANEDYRFPTPEAPTDEETIDEEEEG
jgi:endogenous inhibitor of DNA gyrase (YacG/DUF329 family)